MNRNVPPTPRGRARRGFSLIELVIVVLIIGTLATIAVPRLLTASDRSQEAAKAADVATLQRAIDMYIAEHGERCPAMDASGTVSTDAADFGNRLVGRTRLTGQIDSSGTFGPYLRDVPVNPRNGKATIRINGAAAGANTHGWRYDSGGRSILADDSSAKIVGVDEIVGLGGGGKSLGIEAGLE